jgi:hypothetical protein
MDWQPGQEDGEGAGQDRRPEPPPPSGTPAPGTVPDPARPARDPRLGLFARDDLRDAPAPSGALALLIDQLTGPGRRCPGATADERIGLLRAFTAIESWSAAGKLGVIRDIMRHEGPPSPGAGHGDLPETWSRSLRYELSGALACSTQSAETIAQLAWQLGALIADQLAGKTYTQVLRLAEQAALTVDPALAGRWREHAQKNYARVTFFREQAGTAGLSGRDLPPDETLAAMASVNLRADEYKESEAFEGAPMDVLRAHAYLDLLNGVPAAERIALAERQDDLAYHPQPQAAADPRAARQARPAPDDEHPGPDAEASQGECPCAECDGSCQPRDDDDDDLQASGQADDEDPEAGGRPDDNAHEASGQPDDDDPDGGIRDGSADDDPGGPGGPGPGGPGPSGPGPGDLGSGDLGLGGSGSGGSGPPSGAPETGRARERRPADLIVPLATLLGRAERPGEIHGFGLLDPALARDLAGAAAASPRTDVCVTVTSEEGYAIGHGCARPARPSRPPGPDPSPVALPARLNLTIPAAALPGLAQPSSHAGPWSFRPRGRPGTEGDSGAWTLTLPGGRQFTVRLDPVPVFECDHAYETRHYQPGDRLRHLVQIRDGTCTFPTCNRHARDSDFEHALPYDKGGRTCACNAGARSRACHQVKQSPGWNLTQPKPGWHRWETPAGRVYEQEPKRYPA